MRLLREAARAACRRRLEVARTVDGKRVRRGCFFTLLNRTRARFSSLTFHRNRPQLRAIQGCPRSSPAVNYVGIWLSLPCFLWRTISVANSFLPPEYRTNPPSKSHATRSTRNSEPPAGSFRIRPPLILMPGKAKPSGNIRPTPVPPTTSYSSAPASPSASSRPRRKPSARTSPSPRTRPPTTPLPNSSGSKAPANLSLKSTSMSVFTAPSQYRCLHSPSNRRSCDCPTSNSR